MLLAPLFGAISATASATVAVPLEEAGPQIELPSAETATHSPLHFELGAEAPDTALVRGLQDARLAKAGTVIGSYGQFEVAYLSVGPDAPYEGTATLRRLVVFLSHNFDQRFRGYVELEWEHAIACSGCQGAVEAEQAFIDALVWSELELNLRGGLILIPFGIINQWHEPPIFHGVDRPRFDQIVIPTTWRELGAGLSGRFLDLGRFELYFSTAPDVLRLGSAGLAGATTQGSLAPANGWMLSGRAEVEPLLGFVLGLSALAGDLGGGSRFYSAGGDPLSLALPLFGVGADARWRREGIEARAVAALFFFPKAGDLIRTYRADGSPHFPDREGAGVPELIAGGYVELAYDLFHPLDLGEHQLLPFLRLERYDPQASLPEGSSPVQAQRVTEWTFGLSYRPIFQVVVKLDYQLRDRNLGLDEKQLNVGLGYMF